MIASTRLLDRAEITQRTHQVQQRWTPAERRQRALEGQRQADFLTRLLGAMNARAAYVKPTAQ
jgi:hypothetical protein